MLPAMFQERSKSDSGAKPASLSMVASVNKPGTGENRMTDTGFSVCEI